MNISTLNKIISRFPKANILVVGDLILDQYIWGNVDRVSPEAPVPIVWANKRNYVPGGAANVANNVRALEGKVSLLGVVGSDLQAKTLISKLKERNINTRGIFIEDGRRTILKTRIIAGHQQVVRVDWEDAHNIKVKTRDKLQAFIQKNIKDFDAVIIEDYGKGLLDPFLLRLITQEARKNKKIVTVDPKEDNFEYYKGATCITPNRKETQNAVRYLKIKDQENKFKVYNDKLATHGDIDQAARMILQYLNLESLLVTLGEDGMFLFEKGKSRKHIPTVAQEVFDVSGAGDTVIGTFTLSLACGANKEEAAYISNFAAGIVVGKLGTAVTNRKELTKKILKHE
ncbi:MAG: D-glycero-beta-D-manno-heptose-7-phosphate kinase [Candidatus Omnitrophica bacterium]|jgi:rfaE bifunctional protein kinase chain/domain|nr:D-glycero-beta-D-manno-heptose-7-phosphate kinase [Candidatus Omnitrophota bacterium]